MKSKAHKVSFSDILHLKIALSNGNKVISSLHISTSLCIFKPSNPLIIVSNSDSVSSGTCTQSDSVSTCTQSGASSAVCVRKYSGSSTIGSSDKHAMTNFEAAISATIARSPALCLSEYGCLNFCMPEL